MSADNNRKTAIKFLELLATYRGVEAMDLVHEDCHYWIIGDKKQFPFAGDYNKQQLENIMVGSYDVHENQEQTVDPDAEPISQVIGSTAEGNRVALETRAQVPLGDGEIYDQTYHWLFEFKDGLIITLKEYLDTQKAMNAFRPIAENPVYKHGETRLADL